MAVDVPVRNSAAAREACRRRWPDLFFAAQFLPRDRRGDMYSVAAVVGQLVEIVVPCRGGGAGCEGCDCQSGDERRRVAGAVLDYLFAGEVTGKAELDDFAHVAAARQLERAHFNAFIDALARQEAQPRYATWSRLHDDLRKSAGSMALSALALLGDESMRGDETVRAQVQSLAVAMRMTTLLARVGDDGRRGRVILPLDDLVAQQLGDRDILAFAERRTHAGDPRIEALLQQQSQRLEHMFVGGLKCLHRIGDSAIARAVRVFANIHARQLERIVSGKVNIFDEPRPSTLWDRLRALRFVGH